MSNQGNQKLRRNVSPSTRQGPLRATQQFGLGVVNGSPARKSSARRTPTSSPTSNKTKGRSLSETAFITERRSPTSPSHKEKPVALRDAHSASLESLSLYLSGQWPKDSQKKGDINSQPQVNLGGHGVFKRDEQTQTPDEWDDGDKSRRLGGHARFVLYKRSKSVGSGDQWGLKSKDIKHKLQRKDASRTSQTTQRYSPIPVFSVAPPSSSSITSQPIKIPIPTMASGSCVLRGTPGKARASVEGLNPEIEKLIISATSKISDDEGLSALLDYPDGHRAPVPQDLSSSVRSVNTQTPSQSDLLLSESLLSSEQADGWSSKASSDNEDSRPQSVSPSFIPGHFDMDEPTPGCLLGYVDNFRPQKPVSPQPNSDFARLPPDGAEKIKLVNEVAPVPQMKTFLTPNAAIRLQPSERSAFHCLLKPAADSLMNRSPVSMLEDIH